MMHKVAALASHTNTYRLIASKSGPSEKALQRKMRRSGFSIFRFVLYALHWDNVLHLEMTSA
jgi:hypothetical protein